MIEINEKINIESPVNVVSDIATDIDKMKHYVEGFVDAEIVIGNKRELGCHTLYLIEKYSKVYEVNEKLIEVNKPHYYKYEYIAKGSEQVQEYFFKSQAKNSTEIQVKIKEYRLTFLSFLIKPFLRKYLKRHLLHIKNYIEKDINVNAE